MKLSILIPAYNEENTIVQILERIQQVQTRYIDEKEIIIVNDGSTDNTGQNALDFINKHAGLEINYLVHPENKGKGEAIRTGMQSVSGEYVIIQDADLEYDPDEYEKLLVPVVKANADVVYGTRFGGTDPHRILFFWHSIGNKFLTFLSNMFTNLNLSDMESGYKLVRTNMMKGIQLKEKGFGIEVELTAKLAKMKDLRIYEVGISYYGRTYAEGKKINWKDGLKALHCIIKYNLFG